MKLITRNTDYAIRAICCLAKDSGRIVPITNLVEKLRMPRPFLRKILQALGRNGMVDSYRGIGGGFKLAKDPRKIYIVDIIEIFQGPLSVNECTFKKKACPDVKKCPLKKKIDKICNYVLSELGSITIGSLIKDKTN